MEYLWAVTISTGMKYKQNNEAIFKAIEHEKIWYLSLPEQNRVRQYKLQSFRDLYAALGLNVIEDDIVSCDKKILNFIGQIPSFVVHISLKISLYQNKEGRIDINDKSLITIPSGSLNFSAK